MRVHWDALPQHVRDAIEERIGGEVVEAVTQTGGFSPGLAARLRTRDGRRCFVKAVSERANPDTPGLHRREAEVVAALPVDAAVPRLLWTYDEAGWVALGFTEIAGSMPAQPWQQDELDLVIDGLQRLHEMLTPSPVESSTVAEAFTTHIKGWDELKSTHAADLDSWSRKNLDRLGELEAAAPAFLSGRTLLNFDVRADNILITNDKMSDQIAYAIVKAVFEHLPDLVAADPTTAPWSVKLQGTVKLPIPYQAGAAKYFAEQGVKIGN